MIKKILRSRADRFSDRKDRHLDCPAARILSRNTTRGINMKHIELTQGKQAIVDDDDYDRLSESKWFAGSSVTSSTKYAYRSKGSGDIAMHRVVLNAGECEMVDHVDGDGLNNTKSNLRICTKSQNGMNSKLYRSNFSGYRGVSWCNKSNKWLVHIRRGRNKAQKHLGLFTCLIAAAKAYDKSAIKYHGEFASLNFPEGD